MKKSFLFALIAVFSFSLLSTSCGGSSDDPVTPVDKEAPKMTIISPKDGEKLYIGSEIDFKANFSDNEALASYKINIHINEGAHEHSIKGDLPSLRGVLEQMAFSYDKPFTITGNPKTYTAEEKIDVPMNITDPKDNSQKLTKPGKYHMVVYVLDKAGNETIVVRNIQLAKIGS